MLQQGDAAHPRHRPHQVDSSTQERVGRANLGMMPDCQARLAPEVTGSAQRRRPVRQFTSPGPCLAWWASAIAIYTALIRQLAHVRKCVWLLEVIVIRSSILRTTTAFLPLATTSL